MPGPGMAVYHATKAYVLSFSEALHRELGGQGVRVTALCPGPVETEFMARAGIPENYFPRFLSRSAERVAQEGYDGLMRGRRVVVPGSDNKVAALAGAVPAARGWCCWMRRHASRAPISSSGDSVASAAKPREHVRGRAAPIARPAPARTPASCIRKARACRSP